MKQWRLPLFSFIIKLIVSFGIILILNTPSYAERSKLLNSAGATATGAGTTGIATLSNFNIPAGRQRALLVFVAFERDHCDKATDVCDNTNTGTTGDLSDNFARESGSVAGNNLQITANLVKDTTSVSKRNALTVAGTPSGQLGFNIGQLQILNSGVPKANTVYFSMETYAIVFNESDINTVLGGAASGTVNITFPLLAVPKSAGDDMIVSAYVYEFVDQGALGIHRATTNMQFAPAGTALAGNSSLTTSTFSSTDMPLGTNDRLLAVAGTTLGKLTAGKVFADHTYMTTRIHDLVTTNANGRFDSVFANGSDEADGLGLTAYDYNGWTSETNFTFQLAASATDKVTGLFVDTYKIEAYDTDTSDAPTFYGRADHKPVPGGIRLGALVDEDPQNLGYEFNPTKGDDEDGVDDEDGITLPAAIKPNTTINITANIQGASGYLSAWADWNHDWDVDDAGEVLILDKAVSVGNTVLSVAVPALLANGESTLRVRVCSTTNQCNTFSGSVRDGKEAKSGEVEDHAITLDNLIPLPTIGSTTGTCSVTGGSDVLFVLDNSSSISKDEYTNFAKNVVDVGNALLAENNQVRIGVLHYGGVSYLSDFGQHIYIERDFARTVVESPIRRFSSLTSYYDLIMDNLAGAIYQSTYTLDGNAATSNGYVLSPIREFNRDISRPLQIVIFTDAERYVNMGTALIDGVGYGFEPNDGSDFTIFNKLKAQGIKFTVILYPAGDSTALPAAAAIASKGGSYTGAIDTNSQDPEGSGTPRHVVEGSTTFTLTTSQVGEIATLVGNICPPPNSSPIISSNGGGATAAINILENQTAVTTVTATDADNDTLIYNITGGADSSKFNVNTSTGVLTFKTAPNFEAPTDTDSNNTYLVQVTVDDGKGGTDVQDITITIKDVLEALTCSGYTATVYDPANTATGWTDNYNINPVGSFSYKEFSNKPTWMSIDTNWSNAAVLTDGVGDDAGYTGTALATGNFDYSIEFKKIISAAEAGNYRFYLTMGDDHVKIYRNGTLIYSKQNGYSGVPVEALASQALAAGDELTIVSIEEQSTNTRLSIQITPLFTNPCNAAPVITSNGSGATAAVSAPENQTAVTTVTATDADADTVTFSITGGADSAKFAINATTGVLTFVTAPNFEVPTDSGANNVYDVQVTASDPNGGTDVQAIAVTVTNVNDVPIITSNGGGATASISVVEGQTTVTTVIATDDDGDTLTYAISGGTDTSAFTINSATGVLQFTTAPNFEVPTDSDANNTYVVEVSVSDGKGGIDKQLITVTVTNLIESASVRLRVFLQGPFDDNSTLMHDKLRQANLIPLTQPYSMTPFKYQGTEQTTPARLATTGISAIVDWILIELRSTPTTVIARKAALVTRSGDVVEASTNSTLLNFNNVDSTPYYVTILHRNHLAVMSSTPLSLAASKNALVDFTLPTTKLYGATASSATHAALTQGVVSMMWAGDANRNQFAIANGAESDTASVLNAAFLASGNMQINSNYLVTGYSSNDIDMNGFSLFAGPDNDLNILVGNVLSHKLNSTMSANYVIKGSLSH